MNRDSDAPREPAAEDGPAMTPKQVAASYDRIAQRWVVGAFDRTNAIRQHHVALRFASPPGPALDVGCGSSGRIIELFRSRGFQPEGLDLSPEMLRLARLQHPEATWHEADICTWTLPHSYGIISAWDSIWHVPLAQQPAVLRKLLAGLSDGGVLIFSAGGTPAADEHRDEAMGVPMYHATPGVPALLELIHHSGCLLRHFEYDQYPELHVYFVVQRPLEARPLPLHR